MQQPGACVPHMSSLMCSKANTLFACCCTGAGLAYSGLDGNWLFVFHGSQQVARTQGLEAVGALLVILNISFVVLELVLIAVVGASQTKRYVRKAVTLTRKGSFRIRDSFSRVVSRVRGNKGTSASSRAVAAGHSGAPPLSTMKARPSGTLSDDSSAVSMRRGDSMQLFLNAPVSHLQQIPSEPLTHLDRSQQVHK